MNELKTISIDGVEHDFASFTDEQKGMVAHVNDLNEKLNHLQFQATQLQVAKDAFIQILKNSLTKPAE